MAKQSQLEKAIATIDADIAVLEAAKARLVKEQQAKTTKARKKTAAPRLPAYPAREPEPVG